MTATSLPGLVDRFHRRLETAFMQHQHRLVLHDFDAAVDAFADFRKELTAHMEAEDEVLLPAHDEIVQKQWPTTVYRQEHRKITRLLQRVSERLDRKPAAAADDPQWLIELLDLERKLKHVLEHHEAREEHGLLPELLALPEPRIREMTADLEQRWQAFLD